MQFYEYCEHHRWPGRFGEILDVEEELVTDGGAYVEPSLDLYKYHMTFEIVPTLH